MLCPDGKLNVDLLRKEIASDVSLHDRYRAEDAMKKRAIHSSELVPRCRAQYSIYSTPFFAAILTNRSLSFHRMSNIQAKTTRNSATWYWPRSSSR